MQRLDRLRHEQDPVRAAALDELATLPRLLNAGAGQALLGKRGGQDTIMFGQGWATACAPDR